MLSTNEQSVFLLLTKIYSLSQYHNFENFEAVAAYSEFINKVDLLTDRLEIKHKSYLNCQPPGCDKCCTVTRSVLPVEAAIILKALAGKHERKYHLSDKQKSCAMLLDSMCVVYNKRPLICRTHGLPLLVIADEEAGISFCELNFKEWPQNREFSVKDIVNIPELNNELREINELFVTECLDKAFDSSSRINLFDLLQFINNNT